MTERFYWTPPGSAIEVPLIEPTYVPQAGRTGLDNIGATLYSARAPYEDGARAIGGSFDPREVVFPFVMIAEDPATMPALRRATMRLFAPNAGVGVLRWVHEDGVSWVLRCRVVEGVRWDPPGALGQHRLKGTLVLQADDPFFYDAALNTASAPMFTGGWSLGAGDPPGTGEWGFPLSFGTRTGVIAVNNAGDVAVPCTLTLTGPARYPQFENLTTGDVWKCTQPLLAGEQLIVSSVFGAKTVYHFNPATGVRTNALATLRMGSQWIDLVPGPNEISFAGSEGAESATLTVEWYARYLGA